MRREPQLCGFRKGGRYRFAVMGYVVMPEHFHMLVSEPQRMTLSTVMQALKLGFSRRWLTPGPSVAITDLVPDSAPRLAGPLL